MSCLFPVRGQGTFRNSPSASGGDILATTACSTGSLPPGKWDTRLVADEGVGGERRRTKEGGEKEEQKKREYAGSICERVRRQTIVKEEEEEEEEVEAIGG